MLVRRLLEARSIIGPDFTISQNPANTLLTFGSPTLSGADVTEYTAESISAVYACVRVLADSIAQVPFKLFLRTTDGGRTPDEAHPLYTLIHDLPNPEMTSFDVRATMARWLFLWGDAYSQIDRDPSGRVRAIWPLRSDRMTVDRDHLNRLRYRYRLDDQTEQVWFFNANTPPIWHWRINSLDGVHGRSPIRLVRESFGLSKAALDYGARFFGNGGQPAGVLTAPGTLTDIQANRMRQMWEATHGAADRSHRVAVLEAGPSFTPLTIPPDDSQFIQTRAAQVEDICRIFGVPPFMVGATTTSTSWGSGIEEQKIGYVTFTLTPHFEQIQQASRRDLLSRVSFNSHDCLFVLNGLLRGDLSRRFEAYLKAHNRWLTTNEIRELEDMNPIAGGDEMGTPAGTAVSNTPKDVAPVNEGVPNG